MNENFEPTILPFNKNSADESKMIYESINISKPLIDNLCTKENLKSSLCLLSAVAITLTKYINSSNISILTNIDSDVIPLVFNDENRKKTVNAYMKNIERHLNHPPHDDESEFYFNFIYGRDVVEEDDNTTLIVNKIPQFYVLKLRFDAYKYTKSYIKSFLKSIKRVIDQFAEYGIKQLMVKDIELRCEEEIPPFKLLRNPLVNELLESQAKKTPEKIALRTCGESYTFRQINDEANMIANALIKRGITKGSVISFMLARNKTLITTFLGIIKAGCVAVPMDMNYPIERINYIRKNSDSKYIITYESLENSINPQDLINEGNKSFPIVSLKADDPIFILYTSGSTGKPKGVVLTHCGISNLISVHIKNNYEKLLSISSIAFDISEEDILVSLTNGKELIFANDNEIKDIILLSHLIEKAKPEFVNLTPSRLLSYLQVPEFANVISIFKGIGAGGEQFTKNIFESIKKYADIDIYNGYGPLETSLTSNSKKIENPDFITNGKPLLNYITDVRDIDGKLLPYGVIGELYIGGVGVSKGYYNMKDKTREAFLSINDIAYYKSGDYAIQLPSNEIIIKGRIDNQIKLRGQRVDPEEIEQTILKYPNINKTVVIAHELNQEMHLCAYFTSKSIINTSTLKEYLKGILSPYMIPTFFIQLDEIPETPNGKTDRKRLPKPKANIEKVPAKNNIERKILDFCKKMLNNDEFGVTDNLFNLGFTSLTLMQLNSHIYHEFNITLKHTDLMNNPSIREISKIIENNESIHEIEIIKPVSSNKYPMSSQQKRLYVLYRQNPTLTNYNLTKVRKFKKSIDIERLENAINKIIDVEEILRTSFNIENGEYIQEIHKNRPIHVDFIELDGEDNIDMIFHQNIRPFNLENEPLLRIKVIKFKEETYVFRDMHHIIGDQITNDLLYDKIKDAYYGKPISTSKIKYKDYTFWVQKQQAKETDYWKNKDISDSGSEVFVDFKRPMVQTFNGNKISRSLDMKTIEKLAKKNNTTIYKLLLSQFMILLHKYTNENNIQIGTVTSGRTHPNLEKTLGMFVNTLPFIQSISPTDTLRETLIKTEEELANLFSNQDYSIEQIIEDHKIPTNNSYNPLFNIVFIQNTADSFENDLDWDESKFDLTCTLKNSLSKLTIEFDYNTDLYTFEKINALIDNYTNLIEDINQNMDKKIEDINVLSHSQEEMILEMSGINKSIKSDSILTRLKRQIKKHPAQVILSDCKYFLNYNEFNLKTNSLANYLKDNFDVKKQDTVVLIANRSIESVLGFYSILKLNAVYVPINPMAPQKRIKHIIDEVDAKLVLTNIYLTMDDVDIVDLTRESLYDYDYGELELSCQDKLCILHTSGTTGVPKGVQVTHENIINFLISADDQFYDKNTKIFYHTTNIGFDTSLFEIIFSILNGIQLHVIDENYDFTQIPEDILNRQSMINTVPSKMKLFFTLPNFENVMKNVGLLILAGEALNKNLVDEIRKNYNPVIFNAYGPCEATIFASIKKITSDKITIGKANINTHIYILNNEKQLCPIGIPGELCIGGKQVADGYLNKIVETNRHFLANPFDDGILYCTGDLAYLDMEGEINYIGRKDSQIKINGQRIEIEEINKQIEKNEFVIQAITVPNSRKTQLYSYVVGDKVIDTDKLLNDLENVLLPFMVPVSIMQIESIPLNSSGKIDTKKLPQPKPTKHKYTAPANDIESAIVKIWESVLDVKPVGINDNFYRLGGDSIKAIRIVSLLQNEGILCNPRDILNYKTPYMIAQNVMDGAEVDYETVEGIFDLHPIQNYFFDQVNRHDYTQEFILESAIDLDIHLLQKALDELTNLHDMLRAKFHVKEDKYVQEILPLNTRICEINEFKINGEFNSSIAQIIKNATNSLDIFNKLIDVSLVRKDNKCYLIFVIHHLIVDGVSWSIILDDLTYIYNYLVSGGEIYLNKSCSYESWIDNIKRIAREILNKKQSLNDSTIVCTLSESQLGIYLDEKVNNKNTAYLTYGLIDCGEDKSSDEIAMAISSVIDKHPILKARIIDNEILPLLICDVSPDISITSDNDLSTLLKVFNIKESLSRFYIIEDDEKKSIFFEAHHLINDANSGTVIKKDLISALEGNLDDSIDLGFVNASYDSFKSQFEPDYESAHEFYTKCLADIDTANTSITDCKGSQGFVSLPIPGIKSRVEEFTSKNGITSGNFLNAAFAYTYSRFTDSKKVYFNFTEHGRHEEYAKTAVGMFTRTVPILVDCTGDSVNEYLIYFSDLALGSMSNDVYPFRLLASEFNLNNDVIFEYNFDLNDVSDLKNGLVVRKNIINPISDLLCVVNDMDDGYVVSITHSDKISSDWAIDFAHAYAEVLTQMLDKGRLSDIDYCSFKDMNQKWHSPDSCDILDSPYGDSSKYLDNDYVEPTTVIERIIVEAFEVVFNQRGIGLNDDFIRLGGDSIAAIRVISLLNKKGISCPARDILNYKTPYMIAQNIENTQEITYEDIKSNTDLSMQNNLDNIYHKGIPLNKSYSYKNWIGEVKQLVSNISQKEKEHWIGVNDLLDDSEIKGTAKRFHFKVDMKYNADNLLMLSEEEYWALAIARAYKTTYRRDIIFNRESYGRDESIANLYRTVGWFTSIYPVPVDICGNSDNISLVMDVYKIKTAFRKIKNLGLNYASLIYIADELEYKHCPVTFNFLSTEFVFKNNLLKSVNYEASQVDERNMEVYGVDFNINRIDNNYHVSGDFPENTYIGDKFSEFMENIKFELGFISDYTFEDENIICALSEPQLEVYCNEKNHDMGNAYSTWETVPCPLNKTIDEIKGAIHTFINKHPILKGHIIDSESIPLLICDSYPLIEILNTADYSRLLKPFDLEKYLARFFIIDKEDAPLIFYDIHHIINDAFGFNIIKNDLTAALEGNLDDTLDLGFIYASRDSFESKFEPSYETTHEFYTKNFAYLEEINKMQKDLNGSRGFVSLPIHGISNVVEEFAQNNNITVGILLNAVFAYTYSRFIGSDEVYYNFVEHGRHERYNQESLGMYARTTPILVDCRYDNIKDYLDYFSDLALSSMSNNIYPYRLLEKEFNLDNIVLFEYNFDLNDVSNIKNTPVVKKTSKDAFSEFFCVINDLDDGYVIQVNHTDMFSSDTAIRFVNSYAQILTQILNKTKLGNLDIS